MIDHRAFNESGAIDVVRKPCAEVIERHYLVVAIQQGRGEMRAHEARPARDQAACHGRLVQRPYWAGVTFMT